MQKVATVFISDNVTMRRSSEDNLALDLMARGVDATPAYAVIGDQVQDIEQAKARLRERGFDGMVAMRIVDREQNVESMPSTIDGYWGWGYPGYWGYGYSGYTYTETIYRIETTAFDLRNNQLLWSAMTKTVDPENARDLIRETSELVSTQLVQRNLAG